MLDRGNYRELKLTDHVIKAIERELENIIRGTVKIDEMQFAFCFGLGATDAISILRQLQGKYLVKHGKLHMTFVDLEKAFNRVPRKVFWWVRCVVGLLKCLVKGLQAATT